MSHLASPQYKAAAPINSSTFVKLVADDHIEQCGAGDPPVGVMHESTWYTPIPGADPDVAVIAGQSKRVYGPGETCEVRAGGTLTAGTRVKSDANGAAVAAANNEASGGIVLSGAASGARAKILVDPESAAA